MEMMSLVVKNFQPRVMFSLRDCIRFRQDTFCQLLSVDEELYQKFGYHGGHAVGR